MEIMERQAEIMNRFTEDMNTFETKTKVKNEEGQQKKPKALTKNGESAYMQRLNHIANSLDEINTSNEVTHKGIKALLR